MEGEINKLKENLKRASSIWSNNLQENTKLNKQLKAIIASLDDLIFLVNQECRFLDVWTNDEVELSSYKEKYIGKTVHELFEKNFSQKFIDAINEVLLTKNKKNIEFLDPNDNEWYRGCFSYIGKDHDEKLISIMVQNINEKKKAELDLKRKNAENKLILDNTQTLMCTHDAEGNILSLNKAGADMTEYTPEEMIGKNLREILAPDVKDLLHLYLEDILTNGSASGTMKIITKTGRIRIWAFRNILYKDELGHEMVIASSMDITERAKTQRELVIAKEKAEKASMAKAEFLSTMSHEIRTPMNAVIGITHLLLSEDPKPSQIENLNTLKFSAENLLSLINDILDFSKIESGKIEFDQSEFSIDNLINSIRQTYKQKADEKNISLKYSKDDELPKYLIGDSTRLFQIINNLVNNAIKFTEKGTVRIDIEVLTKTKDQVRLFFAIEDTGIGISEENFEKVFEHFSQEESDTTRKYGGSGLGLAIIKNLIELQGSEIKVESKKGEGSKFYFELDFGIAIHQEENTINSSLSINKKSLEGIKILLVEDNKINIRVASDFLSKWGAVITTASNGVEALKKINDHSFDVVLMDLQMPEMDGFEATTRIRELNIDTPIIALTASALLDIKDKVTAIGMNDFITKPFNPDELYKKLLLYIKK